MIEPGAGRDSRMRQSPVTSHESPAFRPGRSCPLSYRYAPEALAHMAAIPAETLYVIGGLYGNRPALDWIEQRARRERGPVAMVFNGDFNWFNVDEVGFRAVNDAVLRRTALRGNVETELSGDGSNAGCGCAYPDFVGDDEVERSNRIMARLRAAARPFSDLRARLGALPMTLAAEVGGLRVAIVHGDAESLAGWGFSREALREPAQRETVARWFAAARARVFASSHTCLPVLEAVATPGGRCVLANNGAAGMPNFSNTRFGLMTRIARDAAPDALYGTRLEGVAIEAVPVEYNCARFEREFLSNWPAGSPAHESYFGRIRSGPGYRVEDAARDAAKAA